MPIVYSVESYSRKPVFVSSLVGAQKLAKEYTAPAEGGMGDAHIRQHTTPKANMEAILDAMNGAGWADLTTATLLKTYRNGKAV